MNQQFMNLKIRKSLSARINPMFMFYYMYVIGDFCRNNANSTCFQYVDMSGLQKDSPCLFLGLKNKKP